ncbi:MAG: hypothetical protein WBA23_12900 [Tunicatimonas sp.]|uniref:hypothetical protein n=1 Tax=Tunicatimonas sp. TaxID=1940096 RepID=UPI003C720A02
MRTRYLIVGLLILLAGLLGCSEDDALNYRSLLGAWYNELPLTEDPSATLRIEYTFNEDSSYIFSQKIIRTSPSIPSETVVSDTGSYLLNGNRLSLFPNERYFDLNNLSPLEQILFENTRSQREIWVEFDQRGWELTLTFPCPINAACAPGTTYYRAL